MTTEFKNLPATDDVPEYDYGPLVDAVEKVCTEFGAANAVVLVIIDGSLRIVNRGTMESGNELCMKASEYFLEQIAREMGHGN